MNTPNDTAVLITNHASGSGTINVTGTLNVTNNVNNSNERDALEVNSNGGGAYINHQGSGTLQTYGGSGIKARDSWGVGGNVGVTAGSGVVINVNNTGSTSFINSGIRAYSNNAITPGTGNGTVTVNSAAAITATGDRGRGIYADAENGNIDITNSGAISTTGLSGDAIRADTVGNGGAQITNTGNITVNDTGSTNQAFGLIATTAGAGDAVINVNGGLVRNLSSDGDSHAVEARATGAGGDAVVNIAAGLTVQSNAGVALVAWNAGSTITTGSTSIITGAGTTISSAGREAFELDVNGTAASGSVGTVSSQSTITAAGQGIRATAQQDGTLDIRQIGGSITSGRTGIQATSQGGVISVANSGTINTTATAAHGISAATNGAGTVSVTNINSLQMAGNGSSGIRTVAVNGNTSVTNAGNISIAPASGVGGTAIYSLSSGSGDILVTNTGNITTRGQDGILAETTGSGDAVVNSSNSSVTTLGAGAFNHGIEAKSSNGLSQIDLTNSTVTVNGRGAGLVAWNSNSGLASDSAVNVVNSTINAQNAYGHSGAQAGGRDSGSVFVDSNSVVHGGWRNGSLEGNALSTGGATQVIRNDGVIDAMSDHAVRGDRNNDAGALNVTNNGLMTGTVSAVASTVTFDNNGLWNVRNFADTDGDGQRDHFAVALNNLGTSGSNTVTNNGTMRILGHDHQALTLDTTGMYLPLGNAHNTMGLASPTQAQLLGVNTFVNNGVIDMQANADAGDVLVISASQTAGVNGGGRFVTGGTVLMNTVLNEGGANSQSDVLVVDGTQIGSGATLLSLATTGNGAKTVGDGILLVEALDKGASAANAFTIGAPRLVAGLYQYGLYQGGNSQSGGNAADGNWYLRSNYRDEAVLYTVMPSLAGNLGAAMIGSMGDRGGEDPAEGASQPVYEDREVWCKNPEKNFRCVVRVPLTVAARPQANEFRGGWARVFGSHGEYDNKDFPKKGADYDYNMGGMIAGFDVYGVRREDNSKDRAGVYFGAARANANVQSPMGGKAGKAAMDAYSVGAYWTHYGAGGWYLDGLVQGTRYTTENTSQWGERVTPDGYGVAASLEAGYGIKLGGGLMLEPQAQMIFQRISLDSFKDSYSIVHQDDVNDIRGRLGFKFGSSWEMGDASQPRPLSIWAKANVWRNFTDDSKLTFLNFDGSLQDTLSTPLDGTWAEIGLEVRGQVTNNMTMFASGSYNHSIDNRDMQSWGGQVGLKITW